MSSVLPADCSALALNPSLPDSKLTLGSALDPSVASSVLHTQWMFSPARVRSLVSPLGLSTQLAPLWLCAAPSSTSFW